ncbi:hypothetical protein HYH02_011789 [Chlamydomonas schloesseri]|uniref:Alkyl transferase n=1 Tax=Chlamydomonas schloesseri TaxID=2026947 RepID=A0A835W3A5_9CHLO|nr:hypothetical protein HYH02_011789 [Chlamydomonas schloesseri]|eukprot:KAG2435494.1 hypothetical protein HYH02_011789 [Chlamydomonas schloesseri]
MWGVPALLNACAKAAVIWLRRALLFLLYLTGHVPEHVAFVMDGNRRYAERQHVDKATGHTHGYGKMVEVIHWCMELGVRHISVYAFSIDNFRRSTEEVTALMRLAENKYYELARDNGLAEREGIRMHIVGDLTLPPPSVQGAAARLMRNTAALRRQRATLNVCFSYTASEESVAAVAELQAAVRQGLLERGDVTPAALHGALRTRHDCPPVDLLVRTSGETRLSDFLLWQAAHAHLCYLPTLWPDLSVLDFARCVLSYQRQRPLQQSLRRKAAGAVAAEVVVPAAAPETTAVEAGAVTAGGQRARTPLNPGGGEPGADKQNAPADAGVTSREQLGQRRRLASSNLPGPRADSSSNAAGAGSCSPGSSCSGGWGVRRHYARPARPTNSGASEGGSASPGPPVADPHGSRGHEARASVRGPSGESVGGAWGRLASFFDKLEDARLAWIASHVDL